MEWAEIIPTARLTRVRMKWGSSEPPCCPTGSDVFVAAVAGDVGAASLSVVSRLSGSVVFTGCCEERPSAYIGWELPEPTALAVPPVFAFGCGGIT